MTPMLAIDLAELWFFAEASLLSEQVLFTFSASICSELRVAANTIILLR